MDLRAIKAASSTDLAACTLAAARNTLGLLHDAEVLAGSGCLARACALAALSVEECGKGHAPRHPNHRPAENDAIACGGCDRRAYGATAQLSCSREGFGVSGESA